MATGRPQCPSAPGGSGTTSGAARRCGRRARSSGGRSTRPTRPFAAKTLPKFYEKFSPLASVFYAILVFSHMHFLRCASASESERSERERGACSRVPFALSCFFRDFRDFSCFSRFFAISDDFERKKAQKSPPNPSKPLQTQKTLIFGGPAGAFFGPSARKTPPRDSPIHPKAKRSEKEAKNQRTLSKMTPNRDKRTTPRPLKAPRREL